MYKGLYHMKGSWGTLLTNLTKGNRLFNDVVGERDIEGGMI